MVQNKERSTELEAMRPESLIPSLTKQLLNENSPFNADGETESQTIDISYLHGCILSCGFLAIQLFLERRYHSILFHRSRLLTYVQHELEAQPATTPLAANAPNPRHDSKP